MLCPVCLATVQSREGVTRKHYLSTGSICPMSGQPYFLWDQDSTRPAVHNRSGGICECCKQRRATDMHHRISAGVGGRWCPANILHVCRLCHTWITENPEKAKQLGMSVDRAGDPEGTPVQPFVGSVLYLSDEVAPPKKGRL